MPWLLRDEQVLASLEVASSWKARLVGLIGRDELDGALLLKPAWSVHTFGVKFPIDVAFLTRDLEVVRMVTMRPWRASRPVWRSGAVLEAGAGAFEQWGLAVGDQLAIRDGA